MSRLKSSKRHSPQGSTIPCLRCGVCCSKFQPRLTIEEARLIADRMKIPWAEWVADYTDRHWPGIDSFLIRQQDGACVFLNRILSTGAGDKHRSSCLIHPFKPSSCKEWTASLSHSECREGLLKNWGLTVDQAGRIEGPADKLDLFLRFVESPQAEE